MIFHGLIKYVLGGDEAEASLYSMHSWRRYLASAMMLADGTDAQIQAALRWASAEALEIYKVVEPEVYSSWLLRAGRAEVTGRQTQHLPRPLPQTDPEDWVAALWEGRAEWGYPLPPSPWIAPHACA